MELGLLLRGIALGLSIAAPVGPIGVLCIRRTLANGRVHGFISGLGAATADAFYGSVAAFGLTVISSALITLQGGMRLVGGLFLCYLGIKTFLARPDETEAKTAETTPDLRGAYLSTLFLTITNPMTILSFAAIFAGFGISAGSGALLVAGVFAGSALWWFILSGMASILRSRLTPGTLVWINRISGVIVSGFGLVALASLIGGG